MKGVRYRPPCTFSDRFFILISNGRQSPARIPHPCDSSYKGSSDECRTFGKWSAWNHHPSQCRQYTIYAASTAKRGDSEAVHVDINFAGTLAARVMSAAIKNAVMNSKISDEEFLSMVK